MSEARQEVYRQHRTAQDKYTYFLLAVTAAATGFSVQRTTGSTLEWSMIPLGLAVLCWGASFYCGCRHLQYVNATIVANLTLLDVELGIHPEVPKRSDYVQAAADVVREVMESDSRKSSRLANAQYRFLVIGAILFIAWHVVDLACQTSVAPPANHSAPKIDAAPVSSSS